MESRLGRPLRCGDSDFSHGDESFDGSAPFGRVVRYIPPAGAVTGHAWVQRIHAMGAISMANVFVNAELPPLLAVTMVDPG